MPFLISASVSNAAHRGLGLVRILANVDRQHFIAVKNKAGLNVKAVLGKNGEPRTCEHCGFALATLQLSEQWLMQSCSATGFKEVTKQARFSVWFKRLSRGQGGKSQREVKAKQYSDVSQ
jgi:hypothetical protein